MRNSECPLTDDDGLGALGTSGCLRSIARSRPQTSHNDGPSSAGPRRHPVREGRGTALRSERGNLVARGRPISVKQRRNNTEDTPNQGTPSNSVRSSKRTFGPGLLGRAPPHSLPRAGITNMLDDKLAMQSQLSRLRHRSCKERTPSSALTLPSASTARHAALALRPSDLQEYVWD